MENQKSRHKKQRICTNIKCGFNGFRHYVILRLKAFVQGRLKRILLLCCWCHWAMKYAVKCDFNHSHIHSQPARACVCAPKHWHTAHVGNGVIICLLSRHIAKSDVGGNHLALMSHIIYLKFKYLNEFPFPHTQFSSHLLPDFVSLPFSWKIFQLFNCLCLHTIIPQWTDYLWADFSLLLFLLRKLYIYIF